MSSATITGPILIALFPFLAFVVGAFSVRKFTKFTVSLSCLSIFISFLFAFSIFKEFVFDVGRSDHVIHQTLTWFDLSAVGEVFKVDMGLYLDPLSAVMLLMVTGVAFLIHLFSTYYMKGDPRYGRFFVYLSLFTSAMLGLVLSDNLLGVFIFWELMGFCSYSLIGFYYEKEGAGAASLKAFMTTRVGDVFFLLGIVALWLEVGSVSFVDLYKALDAGGGLVGPSGPQTLGIPLVSFVGLCIFMGTIGKSAQFPLHVWLPDAMWGPTPCSALIHAATMVAAGVYLSLRVFPLLEAGGLLTMVAYVGAVTAFGAATMALIQTDLKAVLAYSTISQLGYMVLGIGVGAYNPAFMHLITHAVFKACLFLSAGSVIHSLHDEKTGGHVQEMPRMGGLRKKLPLTFLAMLFCTAAISGIPLWAGFVSKDRILGEALVSASQNSFLWAPVFLGFGAAFLTAFYMARMMCLTFFGPPRDQNLYDHTGVEKLSWNRNVPLLLLTLFTFGFWYSGHFFGGWVKLPGIQGEWFQNLILAPNALGVKELFSEHDEHLAHQLHLAGAIISIFLAFGGVWMARSFYVTKRFRPSFFVGLFRKWFEVIQKKYYIDDFYIKGPLKKVLLPLGRALASFDMKIFDRYGVDGWQTVNRTFYRISSWIDRHLIDQIIVDGTGLGVRFFNVILRLLQTGKIQFYFIVLFVILIGYMISLNVLI